MKIETNERFESRLSLILDTLHLADNNEYEQIKIAVKLLCLDLVGSDEKISRRRDTVGNIINNARLNRNVFREEIRKNINYYL